MENNEISHPKGVILDEDVRISYLGGNNVFQEEKGVQVTDRFEESGEQKVSRERYQRTLGRQEDYHP